MKSEVLLHLPVSREFRRRLRIAAAKRDTTIKAYVIEALVAAIAIDEHESKE